MEGTGSPPAELVIDGLPMEPTCVAGFVIPVSYSDSGAFH